MTRLIDADALIPMMKYATTDSEIGVFPIKIGFNAIIEVINNASTIDAVPQWIPCSERLPDALERVLVTSTHGHVYISCIVHGEFEYGGEVIAWMPLPKPYEVKDE